MGNDAKATTPPHPTPTARDKNWRELQKHAFSHAQARLTWLPIRLVPSRPGTWTAPSTGVDHMTRANEQSMPPTWLQTLWTRKQSRGRTAMYMAWANLCTRQSILRAGRGMGKRLYSRE